MKSYTLLCFFLSLAMILCPLCSVEKATDTISKEIFGENQEYGTDENDSPIKSNTVKVMSAQSKNITDISLREYLIGAVSAEMSPSYHEEAIKAQVVASHTLLEYSKMHKSKDLQGADISDSSDTHQGFLSENEQKEKWGDNFSKYREKIEKCVDEVIDRIIQYNDEPICSAFHSISNGSTENASDVWGGSYPYLTSVPSPGDKLSPSYSSALSLTSDEFKEIIEKNGGTVSDSPEKWLGEVKTTSTGMVTSISICGKEYKGTDIRKIFTLKSSTFKCEYKENTFNFSVIGYGHGVGMSQYGADFMARQGSSYKEILLHYYKDAKIV